MGDLAAAKKVLEEALLEDDRNPKLYLQLLDVLMHRQPVDMEAVSASFERALDKVQQLKHKLLFSNRRVEFLEDFGTDISQLVAAQESHSKLTAEIRKEAGKSGGEGDSANGPSGSIKTIENRGGAKRPANGNTTYPSTNSASYGAHHNSQYQQYGSRYNQSYGSYGSSGYGSGGYYGGGGYGGGHYGGGGYGGGY